MDSDELKHYHEKLRKLSFQIEGYLQKSKDSAAAVEPNKGLGRLSRMEAMQDQQMVLELRRRKKRQLLEVGKCHIKDRAKFLWLLYILCEINFP